MKIRLLIFVIFIITFNSCGVLRNKMTVKTFETHSGISAELIYSPIHWETDTFGGISIVKAAFYVPVKLQGIKETLFMQFDLGSTRSMIYGKTLSAFCEKYPALKKDTIKKENYSIFKNASIAINDSQTLIAKRMYVPKDYGQSKIDTNFIIIGTLGYDILGDKTLIIDFKSDRYAISESIPNEMKSKVRYIHKADLNKFPIILPFRLGKKKIRLIYDTGSSGFPILTGTNRLKKISKHRKIEQVDSVNRFGKMIPVYKPVETEDKFENLAIDKLDLGKVNIYGVSLLNKLGLTGNYLYGLTGNVIFKNKILIINRKDNTFGIIE
jgi:hypothetical protein